MDSLDSFPAAPSGGPATAASVGELPAGSSQALLDVLPWGVLALAPTGAVTYLNTTAAALWGVPPTAVVGRAPAQVQPAVLPSALLAALAQPAVPAADYWLPHTQQWVALRTAPAPDGQRWVFLENATSRHEAETAQQRSTQLLLDMEAVAHTGSYEADLTSGSFYFSDGMYRLFGEAPQALKLTLAVIDARSHPADAATVRQVLDEAVRTGHAYTYHRRIRRPDGAWRTLEAHGEVRTDAAGAAVQLRGLVQDVTERVQAEQAREEARAAVDHMLDGSISAICILSAHRDARGRIVDFVFRGANRAAEALNQKSRADMLGRGLLELFPGVRETFFATYVQVVETGEPARFQQQYAHEHYDHWFDVSAVKHADGFIMTFHDITALHTATEQLQASHELLRTTIDSSLDLVQVFEAVRDEQGAVVDFAWVLNNDAAEQVYGDVIGQRLCELNPGVVEMGIFDTFRQVLETGVPDQREHHYQHEQFDGWFYQSTVKQGDGVTTTTHDISARKRLEQELRDSQTLLQDIIDAPNIGLAVYRAVRNEAGDVVDFTHEYINRASQEMLGEDFTGRLFTDHGENGQLQLAQLREVLATGRRNSYLREADFRGRPVWFAITNTPLDGDRLVHTWEDVTARQQTQHEILRLQEELARQVTDKYRTLFTSIDEGFCLLERVSGRPVDFVYVEANDAFARQIGTSGVVGRTIRDVFPGAPEAGYALYEQVWQTGEPVHTELAVPSIGRILDVQAFRVENGPVRQVAVVFIDITARKRREADAALLVAVTEDLNRLAGEEEMLAAVGARLTQHFDLACWHYVDVDEARAEVTVRHFWHAQAVPSIVGTYPLAGFLSPAAVARMQGGAPSVVADVQALIPSDSAAGRALKAGAAAQHIAAYIAVPYSVGGQWKAYFAVADSRPRPWTDAETALVQDVAARVFPRVERARAEAALRASEEQFRTVANLVPDLLWRSTLDSDATWYNEQWYAYTGQTPETAAGYGWTDVIHPDDRAESGRRYREAVANGQLLRQEHRIRSAQGEYRWFQVQARALRNEQGTVTAWYGAATDVHARKLVELRLRRDAEADAFRLRFHEVLRPLADAAEIQSEVARLLHEWLAAGWCYYTEIDDTGTVATVARDAVRPGLPSLVGVHDLSTMPEYTAYLRAGHVFSAPDITASGLFTPAVLDHYTALGIRAAVGVPLVKDGRLLAVLMVADTEPREWSEDAVAMLREVAERTWATVERARTETALRQVQESMQIAVEAAEMGSWNLDLTNDFSGRRSLRHDQIFGYDEPQPVWGQKIARCHVLAADRAAFDAGFARAMETGELRFEVRVRWSDGSLHWMACHGRFYFDAAGRPVRGAGVNFDVTERKQAEEARRVSEEKYRTLFENIDEGFALYEVLVDERGQAVDMLYHEANPAFAQQSGVGDVVGRKASELFPHTEPAWLDALTRVYHTGVGERLEDYHADTGRWFSLYYARIGGSDSPLIAVVFNDITERKRREQQAFLLHLSDALRPLTSPTDIQATAATLLGEHLGVDRAYYVDLNYDTQEFIVARDWHRLGAPSHARRYPLGTWAMPWLLNGQTWVCRDVDTDPTLPDAQRADYRGNDIRAAVVVPLLKQGRLAATLVVNQNAPHAWPPQQVALVEETAERTWAAVERARAEEALRVSEEKYRRIFENIDQGFSLYELLVDASGQVTDVILQEVNAAFEQHTGIQHAQGKKVSELVPNLEPVWLDAMTRAYKWGETQTFEAYNIDTNRWITSQYSRLGEAGSRLLSTVFTDITDRKQREQHQEFLLQLSDALRPLADSAALERAALHVLGETLGADRVFLATIQADGTAWSVREEYTAGLPGGTGSYPLSEFQRKRLPQWQAGQLSSVADSETDATFSAADRAAYAAFGLRAAIGVPLVKGGRFTALLSVSHATPRRWTAAELALTSEAAERIWVALERARAEESLAASEQRLRALITNLPGAAAFVVGPDLRYQLTGGEALDAAGLAPADLVGRSTSEAMPPELVPQYETHYRQALAGQGFSLEHTAHGRTFISRGVPLLGAAGQPEAVLVVSYDITARKQAEEALRASEAQLAELNTQLEQRVAQRTHELQASRELLQTVFDAWPTSIVVMRNLRDAAGAVEDFEPLIFNNFTKQVVGRDDFAGQRYSVLFPQSGPTGLLARLRDVAASGVPADFEQHYVSEGMEEWFRLIAVRQDELLVLTSEVITGRKQAEVERLKNLRLLEQAEAVAGLGSWDYDLATGVMRWSEGMYQLTNLPLGQPVSPAVYLELVDDDDRPRAEQLVRQLTAGHGVEGTLRLRVREQIKTVRLKAVVLRDEAGQPMRVLGVDLDISELQRLEQENLRLRLTQQQALFEAVQAAQEEERRRIAEGLHNGIGQLLYATKLRLDRLPTYPPDTDPEVVVARHEANQLLSEAIRETRSRSHELVPLVLEEFGLEAALRDIGSKMSSAQLRLHCLVLFDEEAGPLPPTLQLALYRMAQELAQNIIKHAHGATEASLELETMPGWVLLRAEDNGPGFATSPAANAGLGLRSIRDRVALLDGVMQTGTLPHAGAYVRIRLPLRAA